MISVFEKHGLRIAYPKNWELSEEKSPDAKLQISIVSPETAFWTLAYYDGQLDLEDLANQAVEAYQAEYPDLEIVPVKETVGDATLIGCDLNFICLDLTNTVRIRVAHRDDSSLLLLAQAEDDELEKITPIFDAMSESLLSSKLEIQAGDAE